MLPLTAADGVQVVARDGDRPADLAAACISVPSGTICPDLLRTCEQR